MYDVFEYGMYKTYPSRQNVLERGILWGWNDKNIFFFKLTTKKILSPRGSTIPAHKTKNLIQHKWATRNFFTHWVFVTFLKFKNVCGGWPLCITWCQRHHHHQYWMASYPAPPIPLKIEAIENSPLQQIDRRMSKRGFEMELEFVQSLANPTYLHGLFSWPLAQ